MPVFDRHAVPAPPWHGKSGRFTKALNERFVRRVSLASGDWRRMGEAKRREREMARHWAMSGAARQSSLGRACRLEYEIQKAKERIKLKGWTSSKDDRAISLMEHWAAKLIQRFWLTRRYERRRTAAQIIHRILAVGSRLKKFKVVMQHMAIVRRWKRMEAIAYAQSMRASVIRNFTQMYVNALIVAGREARALSIFSTAAITIQTWSRGWMTRSALKSLSKAHTLAADLLINAMWSHLQRKRLTRALRFHAAYHLASGRRIMVHNKRPPPSSSKGKKKKNMKDLIKGVAALSNLIPRKKGDDVKASSSTPLESAANAPLSAVLPSGSNNPPTMPLTSTEEERNLDSTQSPSVELTGGSPALAIPPPIPPSLATPNLEPLRPMLSVGDTATKVTSETPTTAAAAAIKTARRVAPLAAATAAISTARVVTPTTAAAAAAINTARRATPPAATSTVNTAEESPLPATINTARKATPLAATAAICTARGGLPPRLPTATTAAAAAVMSLPPDAGGVIDKASHQSRTTRSAVSSFLKPSKAAAHTESSTVEGGVYESQASTASTILRRLRQATGQGLLLGTGKDLEQGRDSFASSSLQRALSSPSHGLRYPQLIDHSSSKRPRSSLSRAREVADQQDKGVAWGETASSSRPRPISPFKMTMMTPEMIEERRKVIEMLYHIRQERYERERQARLAKVYQAMHERMLQEKEARKAQALEVRLKMENQARIEAGKERQRMEKLMKLEAERLERMAKEESTRKAVAEAKMQEKKRGRKEEMARKEKEEADRKEKARLYAEEEAARRQKERNRYFEEREKRHKREEEEKLHNMAVMQEEAQRAHERWQQDEIKRSRQRYHAVMRNVQAKRREAEERARIGFEREGMRKEDLLANAIRYHSRVKEGRRAAKQLQKQQAPSSSSSSYLPSSGNVLLIEAPVPNLLDMDQDHLLSSWPNSASPSSLRGGQGLQQEGVGDKELPESGFHQIFLFPRPAEGKKGQTKMKKKKKQCRSSRGEEKSDTNVNEVIADMPAGVLLW